eukprot:Hpha_TRINITY_DN30380_c0_g1::TRINITY_DN30380_c0_g1_i1::g.146899::m.146899
MGSRECSVLYAVAAVALLPVARTQSVSPSLSQLIDECAPKEHPCYPDQTCIERTKYTLGDFLCVCPSDAEVRAVGKRADCGDTRSDAAVADGPAPVDEAYVMGFPWWIFAVIGVCCLSIAVAIVIYCRRKNSKLTLTAVENVGGNLRRRDDFTTDMGSGYAELETVKRGRKSTIITGRAPSERDVSLLDGTVSTISAGRHPTVLSTEGTPTRTGSRRQLRSPPARLSFVGRQVGPSSAVSSPLRVSTPLRRTSPAPGSPTASFTEEFPGPQQSGAGGRRPVKNLLNAVVEAEASGGRRPSDCGTGLRRASGDSGFGQHIDEVDVSFTSECAGVDERAARAVKAGASFRRGHRTSFMVRSPGPGNQPADEVGASFTEGPGAEDRAARAAKAHVAFTSSPRRAHDPFMERSATEPGHAGEVDASLTSESPLSHQSAGVDEKAARAAKAGASFRRSHRPSFMARSPTGDRPADESFTSTAALTATASFRRAARHVPNV